MKNLWFIFMGMILIFILFFISLTDFTFDSFVNQSSPENVQQVAINLPVENSSTNKIKMTTPKKSHITNETTVQNLQKEFPEDEQIYKEEIAEANPENIRNKPISNPVAKVSSLSIESATKVKMKIKAKEKDGIVKAKVSISHTMLTYAQAKKKGVEANFITRVTGLVGKRVVYDASTSQFLSKNPLLKFSFRGKKGEKLTIVYQELKSETFYDTKRIK